MPGSDFALSADGANARRGAADDDESRNDQLIDQDDNVDGAEGRMQVRVSELGMMLLLLNMSLTFHRL